MRKLIALTAGLAMTASLLAGCSSSKPAETAASEAVTEAQESTAESKESTEGEAASGEGLKVALCVTGAVNDMGWCQSAYEGLKLVEKDLAVKLLIQRT